MIIALTLVILQPQSPISVLPHRLRLTIGASWVYEELHRDHAKYALRGTTNSLAMFGLPNRVLARFPKGELVPFSPLAYDCPHSFTVVEKGRTVAIIWVPTKLWQPVRLWRRHKPHQSLGSSRLSQKPQCESF